MSIDFPRAWQLAKAVPFGSHDEHVLRVRATHLPLGISVAVDDPRSALDGKVRALELLRQALAGKP